MSDAYSKYGEPPRNARPRGPAGDREPDRSDGRAFDRSVEDTRRAGNEERARQREEGRLWNDRDPRRERDTRDRYESSDEFPNRRGREPEDRDRRYPDIGPTISGHSRDTDYSGLSFGGGHRTDAHVYAGGTGLEAGYMATPTPEYRRSPSNDVWRDEGRHARYESGFERPVDRNAWWHERSDQGPYVGRGPRGYRRSDERIREELNDRLTAHGYLDATDIECEVANGEVTLTGYVSSRRAKHLAEDVADDIPGVRDVHNQLRIRTSAGEEGVGRTSVLGLTEAETQNTSSARAEERAERTRSRE